LLVHTENNASNDSTSAHYAAWYERYKLVHGVADGPEVHGRIPLECNLDLLHYISFAKGCYVGQELTARTKFKVRMRRRFSYVDAWHVYCGDAVHMFVTSAMPYPGLRVW
jgi:folate-binding protein YgfZ